MKIKEVETVDTTVETKETVQPTPATKFPVKDVKVKVLEGAPHHSKLVGQVIHVVPALAEKMQANGWGEIVKS